MGVVAAADVVPEFTAMVVSLFAGEVVVGLEAGVVGVVGVVVGVVGVDVGVVTDVGSIIVVEGAVEVGSVIGSMIEEEVDGGAEEGGAEEVGGTEVGGAEEVGGVEGGEIPMDDKGGDDGGTEGTEGAEEMEIPGLVDDRGAGVDIGDDGTVAEGLCPPWEVDMVVR